MARTAKINFQPIFLLHMALGRLLWNTALASGIFLVKRMMRNYLRLQKIHCMERLKEHNLFSSSKRSLEGDYSDP